MSKSTPATPDYAGAAQASAASSAQTTQSQTYANRPNINTPWSQQSWNTTPTWDPTTGSYVNKWTQNTNLVPKAQSALDSQLSTAKNLSGTADTLTGQANSQLTQPLNWDNFNPIGQGPQAQSYADPTLQGHIDTSGINPVGTANGYANKAADAAYSQYTNRNQPLQQTAIAQMDTQLQNKGLRPGDQAYDTAMRNLQNQHSDANTQASLGATQFGIQGGQIMQGQDLANNQNQFGQAGTQATFANSAAQTALQDQLASGAQSFGQGMSSANYENQTRQQQISEDLQKRGFTINEINGLLSGNQVQTGPSPQFNAAGASAPTNYSSAAQNQYEAALNSSNMSNSQTSSTVGAGLGVAAAFL